MVENEYGEAGIENGFIVNADERIFAMNGGGICCAFRENLMHTLGNQMKRKNKSDSINGLTWSPDADSAKQQ